MKALAITVLCTALAAGGLAAQANTIFNTNNGTLYEWQTFPGGLSGASSWARARGGMTGFVRNADENTFIATQIVPLSGAVRVPLDDGSNAGLFGWLNLAPYSYRNWAAGQPSLVPGTTDTLISASGTWSHVAAASPSTWLMMYPKFSIYYAPTKSLFILGTPYKTPAQAEAEAVSMGGHLATFQSAAEESFVRDAVNRTIPDADYLIGLSDQDVEGTFKWRNGEPVSYVNWAANEPSNSAANKDSVVCSMIGGVGRWKTIATTSAFLRGMIEIDGIELSADMGFEGPIGQIFPINAAYSGQTFVPQEFHPFDAGVATASNMPGTAMPTEGSNALYVQANTYINYAFPAVFTPPGGPLAQPTNAAYSRVVIPLPDDVASIDFDWEFLFCGATMNSSSNDTAQVSVIQPNGIVRVITLADSFYESDNVVTLPGVDPTLNAPMNTYNTLMPFFAQHASASFIDGTGNTVIQPGSVLSITVTNSNTLGSDSIFLMDALKITRRTLLLEMSAATTPGSFRMRSRFGPPGGLVVRAIQVAAPASLNGWFYGIDIDPADLQAEFNAGYPFTAILDANGADTLIVPSGIVPGIPLVATSIAFTGGSPALIVSKPTMFVTQ